jgi:hypothetical protein
VKILKYYILFTLLSVCYESAANDDKIDIQVNSKTDCLSKMGAGEDSLTTCEKLEEICTKFPTLIGSVDGRNTERRFKISVNCNKYKIK